MAVRFVLSVGQCALDHSNISDLLCDHFDVEIVKASSHAEALDFARKLPFDLILINRILDATATSGMDTIKAIKSDPATVAIPVMLVSNYAEAQEAAIEAGAVAGFGKSALQETRTVEILRPYLAP